MSIADTHLAIAALLAQMQPVSLVRDEGKYAEDTLFLAGVIPFYKDGDGQYHFYLVRPEARKPELPPPSLQIAKGTRMRKREGQWQDISREDLPVSEDETPEPLMVTALREAEEEAGLRFDNIAALYEVGVHGFTSVSSGDGKQMYLAAAEVKDKQAFKPPSEHGKTGDCQWRLLEEATDIRDDHLRVLKEIEGLLQQVGC